MEIFGGSDESVTYRLHRWNPSSRESGLAFSVSRSAFGWRAQAGPWPPCRRYDLPAALPQVADPAEVEESFDHFRRNAGRVE